MRGRGLASGACDRDDGIITGGTKSRFSGRVSGSSVGERAKQRCDKRHTKLFCLFLLGLYHSSCSHPSFSPLFFSFRFCFIAFSFYVCHKRVLSVNSNYPPFLSLNQSFGYRACFPSPSKQPWLRRWPRFASVLLKQYVALCLGFSGMVYECAAQFSHSLFSPVCVPVCYKC